jgi:biotin carboxyl carrier protein
MKKDDKYAGKYKFLNIESVKYRTLLTDKYENRKAYEPINPKMVKAFIPGTIRKIEVKIGDKVKKGDLLLILEAMKMKNRIMSPLDGTIKAINVETGKIVPKNHTLIELK